MTNNKTSERPRRSLRTTLMLWLIMFSVVPLAFITGYSLVKYEQAIDQELMQRLNGNRREIEVILKDFQTALEKKSQDHIKDKQLIYYLSKNNVPSYRSLAEGWLANHFIQRMQIFNSEGRLEVSLYKGPSGNIQRQANLENSDIFLSDKFLDKAGLKEGISIVEFRSKTAMNLISFSKIRSTSGALVGYLEEILLIDDATLEQFRKRLGTEILFLSKDGKQIFGSHDDLEAYEEGFFLGEYEKNKDDIFELNIRAQPYGFTISPIQWGEDQIYLAIGATKSAVKAVLKNVNTAFFFVVWTIIILVVISSLIISKKLLGPVERLVDAVQNMDLSKGPVEVHDDTDSELGILTRSFNDMFKKVHEAQSHLKSNVDELEQANREIRDTQSKLVHTAKMASLGQLVAGVAHELNNPIGFIYSNMGHLKDYSERLIDLVEVAEKDPKKLDTKKADAEFEYIVKDLPKLIKSCEEGAKRTRDIVIGLRNFSRLEEGQNKDIDIHEGIDNTLNLLRGEIKNRIKIEKKYAKLPKINCNPSQLNQVFMNILSNAAQAIADEGTISVTTKKKGKDKIQITIKDTGKGMNAETVEKIFDPFFTTKTPGQGTGLGMSISYGIVENHGGDIQVSSELGKGTEFVITLPLRSEA